MIIYFSDVIEELLVVIFKFTFQQILKIHISSVERAIPIKVNVSGRAVCEMLTLQKIL